MAKIPVVPIQSEGGGFEWEYVSDANISRTLDKGSSSSGVTSTDNLFSGLSTGIYAVACTGTLTVRGWTGTGKPTQGSFSVKDTTVASYYNETTSNPTIYTVPFDTKVTVLLSGTYIEIISSVGAGCTLTVTGTAKLYRAKPKI